ncbi:similar to Saccharomyces cerevisiae YDR480W DIG2 MAP kinase- responsive inhibitor of the Ste12p transcription factor [Maudiozyma barnettii]|uniref:Similar to Saccharomyces cerevisiae YDR480W DIG2 MAP kinase- responsive inhibitor of the Ste12p transcription factor n=1 Tax=Maudiozyma barnettii TaxID=61262 RepID=A0A8H2VG83_9SACH|nr:uncharacterized protein KABA2_05S07370 [Kazachstania barnettii]CAB4255056.1 similar to Saccharomyces cerevisiae YDR480W DIG2 MAP kinase- responsive inhibitor of the Ste12p transcription factor [Kazachstania barnettii]CAD1783327.1 similar to Saccharomyces cerevisiae YDR480W DIG2 MAP kinase- responsive inhibitor of the Ste12p transcription factor [Kazachstania barnettii]
MTESVSARFISKVENIIDPVEKPKGKEIRNMLNKDPLNEQTKLTTISNTPLQNNTENEIINDPMTNFSSNNFNNDNILRPRSSLSTVSNPVESTRKRHISDLLSPRPESSSDTSKSGPQQSMRASISYQPSCSSASECSSYTSSCYSSSRSSTSSSVGSSSTSSRITSASMQVPPVLNNNTKSLKRRKIPPPLNISPTSKHTHTQKKHRHNDKFVKPIPSSAVSSRFQSQAKVVQPRSAPADVTTFQKAQKLAKPRVVYLGKETQTPNKIQSHGPISSASLQVPLQGWYPQSNRLRNTIRYPIATSNTPISAVSPQFNYYSMYPMSPWGTLSNLGITGPQGAYPYTYSPSITAYNMSTTNNNSNVNPAAYQNTTPPPFKGKKRKFSKNNNNIQTQSNKSKLYETTTVTNQTTTLRDVSQNEHNSENTALMQQNNDIMTGEIRLMSDIFSFEFPKNSIPTKSGIKNISSNNINNLPKQLFMNICGRIWDESQLLQ